MASIGVWGTGDLQVIIVSNKTGEHLVVDDRRVQIPAEIHAVLDHYCELIVNGGPFNHAL